MIEILNICLHQNSIFIKFFKILKIHEIFCENPRIIFVLLYDVHTENMFTINLEDGREPPSKASNLKWRAKFQIYRLHLRDFDWLNFIHFSGYKYKIRLVSILRKREDPA